VHIRVHSFVQMLAVAGFTALAAGPVTAADDGTALVAAARASDRAAVVTLIDRRADPNAAQADGATALHWAAYRGDVDLAARLLRAGANADAANDLGVTPLFLASVHEDPSLALVLLEAGANPSLPHVRGVAPLMEAARTGRARTIAALLAHGADVNARETTHDQTALMWAAAHRQPAAVDALVAGGADVTLRSRVRERKAFVKTSRGGSYDLGAFDKHVADGDIVNVQEGGYTALLFAAQQGDSESAVRLIEGGADVNDTAPIGTSALVVAAFSNEAAVGRLLLDRGATPNAADAGYSALHAAILRGNFDLATALIAHGADVNQRITKPSGARRQSADYAFGNTLVGATPVYLAAKFAEIPILRALLAAQADPTLSLPDGSAPLLAAMETGKINSLGGEGLGEDRRDRNVFFRAYNTQSDQEIENDVLELTSILTSAHVDVNAANRAGNTALHDAARAGMNRVVQQLVSLGANVNAKNRRGETALQLAGAPRRNRGGDVFAGHQETTALLKSLGATQ
jgi:ankyrin repeat protein